ncbi:MAG: hypothetical protein EBY80_05720 [Actinobacteria bacterium]|nr:hypothetical protein [Actinomycetota bacterium]
MALEKFSFYKKTAEPVTEPEKVMVQATETLAKMLDLESKVSQISQDLGQFITDSVMAQSLDAIQRQLDPLQQELRANLQNEVARINEALQSLGSKSARLAEFVQEQTEKQNRLIQQTALDLDNKILRLPDQAPAAPDLNYLKTDIQELRTDLASLAQELVQEIQTQKTHQESALLESIIAQDRRLLELQDSLQALVFDPAPIYSDLQQIRESLNADIQLAMDAQVQEISQHLLEQNQKILDKDLQIRQQLSQTMAELKVNLNQKIQTLTQQQETVQDQLDLVQSKNLEFTEKYAHVLDKIEFLQEALDKVNTSTILTEEVMPAPAVSSSDPLTPLDKNFVTFDQLKQHYQLFINRIQQQLSTLGGGGSSTLRELDDIDFISFRDNTVNGWPLVYKSATNKWTSSNVMSDATFTGNVAVQGFLSVAGNIVLADATVDLLTVNSDALFEQNVLVQKNLTVQNNVTVGSLTTNNGVVFATNSGRLNTNSNFTWNGTTLSVNGNFDARYIDVVNGFNLNFATANTIPYLNSSRYLVSTNNLTYNGSNLVLTGNQTVNGILTINNDALIHNSNSYTKIAAGSTEERPSSPSHGMVRYNSSLSTFEGYAANAWGSLGGVKSVDGFTYIIPETSPGASNGELEFYVENTAGTAAFKAGGWDRTELNVYTPLNVYANLIAQTAIIQGNLQVTGNITSLEVQNLSVTDNMIYLNSNSSITNPDLGFAGNYNDGTYAHAGVFRDATDGRWKFFEGYTPEPDTSPYINTGHASFRLATVQASSFVGPVTGNVSDISNHTTTSLAEGSNLYFTNARVRAAVSSGTGVSYNQSTGQLSIGQAVATSSDVSFANITATGTVNVSTSGIKFPTDAFGGSGDAATITLTTAGGEATRMTFTMANDADDKFNFVAPSSTGLLMNGNTVWHAGNDGAGSGLDADLLDGISSASFLRSDASATNSVDLRAPIFYDSDDTAYYVNPRSASRMSGLRLDGVDNNASGDDAILWINKPNNADWAMIVSGDLEYGLRLRMATSHSYAIQVLANGTEYSRLGSDLFYHNSNIRAPIFYDNNNTGYYLDPASSSNFNQLVISSPLGSQIYYHSARDFPNGTLIQTNIDYIDYGAAWALEIKGNGYGGTVGGGPWDLQYQGYIYAGTMINVSGLSNGTNITGMSLFRYNGKLCFWFPYQAYWQGFTVMCYIAWDSPVSLNQVVSISNVVKPAGIDKEVSMTFIQSVRYGVSYSGSIYGSNFYDNDNTSYYVDPAAGVSINVAGEIRAANNITAYYSDMRLKRDLGTIEQPLLKLKKLRGFYYEANETAQKLGYRPIREVGVSAQDVADVLPEIVKPAPIDEKYLTIHYERLVPLLIEAIKELNLKVERLEQGTT